jgi:hypothetical protein
MNLPKKCALALLLSLGTSSAYSAMLPTPRFTAEPERAPLFASVSQRQQVERQLIELGVPAADASERVSQMTDAEIARLQGKITELPAGGRLSTIEWLLIIIVVILVL